MKGSAEAYEKLVGEEACRLLCEIFGDPRLRKNGPNPSIFDLPLVFSTPPSLCARGKNTRHNSATLVLPMHCDFEVFFPPPAPL